MKKLSLAVITMIVLSHGAKAAPYFRFAALHPAPVLGALLAAEDLKQSEASGQYPIFSHSPKDGCFLPSIVCEDWSPLAVGVSVNAGNWSFSVGPIFNVLPWMQGAALKILPDSWDRARSFFEPAEGEQPITFSAGPTWEFKQATNKGYYRTFTGAALHF